MCEMRGKLAAWVAARAVRWERNELRGKRAEIGGVARTARRLEEVSNGVPQD